MPTGYQNEPVFIDTSLLIYGYVESKDRRHAIAKELIKRVFGGAIKGYISNQVIAELSHTLLRKYKTPTQEVQIIANGLSMSSNWVILNYGTQTAIRALELVASSGRNSFFDALIAATMKENGITEIITENEEDFAKIPGISVRNPFRP